ncbi:MAG: hypothetical protein ACJAVY_000141 [Marinoscillum sp.]
MRVALSSFLCLYLRYSLLYCLIAVSLVAHGQTPNCLTFSSSGTFSLDSLPIDPSSVVVSPELEYDLINNYSQIKFSLPENVNSVQVCFRKLSPVFQTPIFYRDVAKYEDRKYATRETNPNPSNNYNENFISFGELETYGAITRGVSFGNRQNVFVNSALNLQMDGKLSENLNISAVITDQNIPYQPEGNTQQLRDFDNVFIKFYNEKFSLTAGDVVLKNPVKDSYFLQYQKNVQGIALSNDYQINDRWKSTTFLSVSLSKGQFTSAVITPIEGVQGPYKLRGAKGERFIIVLANSEKVFLDGRPLDRGFDRDYVIDYNLGEITFSTNVVITQFSRIRIDYEYSNQYYARSNLTLSEEVSSDNLRVYFNYYREKDQPNNSNLFNDLSEEDLNTLQNTGDANGLATISGADSIGFSESAILYEKIDSLLSGGNTKTIYRYSTDPNKAYYQLSFTQVGQGLGSYELTKGTANGSIYNWVGEGNGLYEPIRVINTPNQRQMMVAGAEVKISAFETFTQETAFTNQDQNLYSNLDDTDNAGIAWRGKFVSNGRDVTFFPEYKFHGDISFEFNDANFLFIDRYRSADFDRDWGYDYFADGDKTRSDKILQTEISIAKDNLNQVTYDVSWRERKDVVSGFQQQLRIDQLFGPISVTSRNFLMINDALGMSTDWWRSSQKVQWMNSILKPGYEFSLDQQVTSLASSDSISSTLMHFKSHNVFVEQGDSLRTKIRLDYIQRVDDRPLEGVLESFTEAREYRMSLMESSLPGQKITAHLTYRTLDYLQSNLDSERNLLGGFTWFGSFAKGHLTNNLTYNTANTRELKRDFIFISVPTGDGTHTWRDENGDGVQDLNEFYEAVNQDEKAYIKLFTPTDEYQEAFLTTYTQTIDIKAPKRWRELNGWWRTLSKLSSSTNLRYQYRTTSDELADRLIPFGLDLGQSDVLSARKYIRNSIFLNRNAPGFGADITQISQGNKSLLSNGFQINQSDFWQTAFRFTIASVFTMRGKSGIGRDDYRSDFLASRNFEIDQRQLEGELIWQPSNDFRLITGYSNKSKFSENEGMELTAKINDYKIETTWVKSNKGNLNTTFNWVNIAYEGPQNTFLAYQLLEALQPGDNQRWNVNWQQSLNRGLQLSLQYYGRKSENTAAVHTGSVQVTAFF